jgi:hypothetical protein
LTSQEAGDRIQGENQVATAGKCCYIDAADAGKSRNISQAKVAIVMHFYRFGKENLRGDWKPVFCHNAGKEKKDRRRTKVSFRPGASCRLFILK